VVVLGVNKRPDRQINYGTGGVVNEESVDDGRVPVKIRWYSDSYIDLPIRRAAPEVALDGGTVKGGANPGATGPRG